MQELDSSQNDTEFKLKSPNWAGGHSIVEVRNQPHESNQPTVRAAEKSYGTAVPVLYYTAVVAYYRGVSNLRPTF